MSKKKIIGVTVGTALNPKKIVDDAQIDYTALANLPQLGAIAAKDEISKTDLAADMQALIENLSNVSQETERLLAEYIDEVDKLVGGDPV